MGIGERGARRQILLIYRFWKKINRSNCVYVSRVGQIAVSDQCASGLGVKCERTKSFHDAELETAYLISSVRPSSLLEYQSDDWGS